MALPTLVKTWQITANTSIPAAGSNSLTAAALLIAIKNMMKGAASGAWTVVGSSDARSGPLGSSGMDGVDRWSSTPVVVAASAGSRHPWIVLRQTAIAANFEVCMDFTGTSMSVYVSPSAGFTGGSDTARPTATDEITFSITTGSGSDIQHYLHAWQSTDGQCTRFAVYAGGSIRNFVIFDKPQNPVSGWTSPSYSNWVSGTAATHNSWTSASGRGRGTTTFNINLTGEGSAGTMLAELTDVGTVPNSFDSSWTLWPIGMCSTTLNHKGRHGSLFDIWWRPTTLAAADTFPNNAATRQFVCVGSFVMPWKGDSTTMLLT